MVDEGDDNYTVVASDECTMVGGNNDWQWTEAMMSARWSKVVMTSCRGAGPHDGW